MNVHKAKIHVPVTVEPSRAHSRLYLLSNKQKNEKYWALCVFAKKIIIILNNFCPFVGKREPRAVLVLYLFG